MWYELTGSGFYCAQHKWTLANGLNKKKKLTKQNKTNQKNQNQKKKTKDFPKTISKGKAWNILSTPFPFWQDWEWLPWILWFVGEGGAQVMAGNILGHSGPTQNIWNQAFHSQVQRNDLKILLTGADTQQLQQEQLCKGCIEI